MGIMQEALRQAGLTNEDQYRKGQGISRLRQKLRSFETGGRWSLGACILQIGFFGGTESFITHARNLLRVDPSSEMAGILAYQAKVVIEEADAQVIGEQFFLSLAKELRTVPVDEAQNFIDQKFSDVESILANSK